MPTITTTRSVEHVVACQVEISTHTDGDGFHVRLNGQSAISITTKGYLRRHRGLTANAGVRLLDDGRIAIKPAAQEAT